jgi:hypothetical protein
MRSSILLSLCRGTLLYYSVGAYYYCVGEDARDMFEAVGEGSGKMQSRVAAAADLNTDGRPDLIFYVQRV